MPRIRLAFAVAAVAVLLPLGLLLRTAWHSAEAERDLQHRIVADRITDELERELTALLEREEDRPFAHYRFAYLPEPAEGLGPGPVRSPLAAPPAEPFVVGYFQVAPDGTLSSPLVPDDPAAAARLFGWSPDAARAAAAERVELAVRGLWRGRHLAAGTDEGQGAGTTLPLRQESQPEEKQGSGGSAPERYFDQLNRAISQRADRKSKLSPVQSANVVDALEEEQAAAEADDRDAPHSPAAELRRSAMADTVEARLEPMVGQPLGDGLLVLHRTVLVGDRAFRQGLVVEIPALLEALAARVLAASDLAGRAWVLAADTPTYALPPYAYRHRFADPFGAMTAIVALDPLPGLGGRAWVVTLSLLLVVAAAAGLLAIYRMVAVVVGYAERRSNFVSAVTHELKTPLTALRMYGEMLRDGVVPDESRRQRYYETITAEGERLSRLLDNVLELSRLERRDRPIELAAGDPTPVVEHVLGMLRPHAEKQGFRLAAELEPELPAVVFERDALTQVLFNLVDNAIKYSQKAAEKVVVVRCSKRGEGVALVVSDRGPGVARRHLERIFEPFYRGEDELTRTAEGTGIGLALVRGLVERMGGSVRGENAAGGGFEVTVLLAGAP